MGRISQLLNTERRAWVAVLFYTVLLYSTLTIAYESYLALYRRIGRDTMSLLINLSFLVCGLPLLGMALRSSRRAGRLTAFALIVLAAAFCLWQLATPAKRLHFFEYAPLTLLLLHAVSFRCRDRYRWVWTLALVALIGLGDETIQGMLEKRHFGVADVVVNTVAGLLTLAFTAFVAGDVPVSQDRVDQGAPGGQ